jgi:hypothetical protein
MPNWVLMCGENIKHKKEVCMNKVNEQTSGRNIGNTMKSGPLLVCPCLHVIILYNTLIEEIPLLTAENS